MDAYDSIELFARVRAGDERAAELLFERYLHRLLSLAESRFSLKLKRKVDPEDVVQSALGSFFAGAVEGNYDLRRSGDLWRLLAKITIHKLLKRAEYYAADKRKLDSEQFADCDLQFDHACQLKLDKGPAPEDLAALREELDGAMSDLSRAHGQMLTSRLQGESIESIAGRHGVTERQVRRVLQQVEARLRARLTNSSAASGDET